MNIQDIQTLKKNSHEIGGHSKTHISLGLSDMNEEIWEEELHQSRKCLETIWGQNVNTMAYPFGEPRDVFDMSLNQKLKNSGYQLCFSIEPKWNKRDTNPYNLGRIMPHSQDNFDTISKKINELILI